MLGVRPKKANKKNFFFILKMKKKIIYFVFIIPWSACHKEEFCWEVEMKAKETP